MAMAQAAQQRGKRRTPPNLRQATGSQRCGNCTFFGSGKCRLYGGFPVSASQTCNSFRPKGG